MIHIFYNYPNRGVTNFYLSIISDSLNKQGLRNKFIDYKIPIVRGKLKMFWDSFFYDFGYKNIPKNDWILVSNHTAVINLYLHGYKNIILWSQGALQEESYMRNKSLISAKILGIMEKYALKLSKFTFLVSSAMKNYYERFYKVSFGEHYFIMPCFNSILDLSSFDYPGKYENNIFTYVGSTATWQCVDESIRLYKKIEDRMPNTEIRIFTKDIDKAKNLLIKYKVRRGSVKFVNQTQLKEELKCCKYGFMVRKDNIVNNVSTPTKISSYLASGVIPILTGSIHDFSNLSKSLNSVCLINDVYDFESIIGFMKRNIDICLVKKDCQLIFSDYYNASKYIDTIGLKIIKCLGNSLC